MDCMSGKILECKLSNSREVAIIDNWRIQKHCANKRVFSDND